MHREGLCHSLSLQLLKSGVIGPHSFSGRPCLGMLKTGCPWRRDLEGGCAHSHLSLDFALEGGQPLAKNGLLMALGLGSRLLSPEC